MISGMSIKPLKMAAAQAAENELNILPYVRDVIKSIDKDNNDVVTQKMLELKTQFQRARECIDKLPGTQHSQEEQLRRKAILHQQLRIKSQILYDYKSGNSFDLSQLQKTNGTTPSSTTS